MIFKGIAIAFARNESSGLQDNQPHEENSSEPREEITKEDLEKRTERIIEKMEKEGVADKKTVSDLGYVSHTSVYRAANCSKCPLRGMCYSGKCDRRTIEVNYKANSYKSSAKKLLTSQHGLIHRSNRPIEPEACFGNIKFNHGLRRFHLKSTRKTKVEWGIGVTGAQSQKACRS